MSAKHDIAGSQLVRVELNDSGEIDQTRLAATAGASISSLDDLPLCTFKHSVFLGIEAAERYMREHIFFWHAQVKERPLTFLFVGQIFQEFLHSFQPDAHPLQALIFGKKYILFACCF